MPQITDHIRLYIYDKQNQELTNEFYEFQVNPSSIEVTDEMTLVVSNFLRQDGGVVRPTQRKLRTIKGTGKFFDIPSTAVGNNNRYTSTDTNQNVNTVSYNNNQFPLVNVSPFPSGYKITNAFDMYKGLLQLMNEKQLLRFDHQYIGQIYVFIQSLTLTNTSSENTVDFSFSLLETLIDTKSGTGFERDANQQVPGEAIPAQTSTLQFLEYKTKAGDTLARLALKFFGSASKYGLILDYNENISPNPSAPLYPPSLTLKILKTTSAPLKQTGGVTPEISPVVDQGISIAPNGMSIDKTRALNNIIKTVTSVAVTPVLNSFSSIFSSVFKISSNLQRKQK